jgi:hypothetical protein
MGPSKKLVQLNLAVGGRGVVRVLGSLDLELDVAFLVAGQPSAKPSIDHRTAITAIVAAGTTGRNGALVHYFQQLLEFCLTELGNHTSCSGGPFLPVACSLAWLFHCVSIDVNGHTK